MATIQILIIQMIFQRKINSSFKQKVSILKVLEDQQRIYLNLIVIRIKHLN